MQKKGSFIYIRTMEWLIRVSVLSPSSLSPVSVNLKSRGGMLAALHVYTVRTLLCVCVCLRESTHAPQGVSCSVLMMFCSFLGLDPPLIHLNFLFYQPCPASSQENHCSTTAKVPHFSPAASLLFSLQVNWVFFAT